MSPKALAPLAPLLAALSTAACGAAAPARGPQHDLPVPPGEPRASLRLRLDLTPAQRCEEAFDLALYQDRGVDLIQWDARADAPAAACAGRTVTIRYLPRRLGEAELLAAVRRLAARVEQLPAQRPSGARADAPRSDPAPPEPENKP